MTTMDVRGRADLSAHGIQATGRIVWQPTTSMLYEDAVRRGQGRIAEGGPLAVDTGKHTGRSPKDKFIVREPGSEDRIWWAGNGALEPKNFDVLRDKVVAHIEQAPLVYVIDAYAGADPKHRISVRVVTTLPYHALFAKTMFIEPARLRPRAFQAGRTRAARARGRERPEGRGDALADVRRAAPGPHRAPRRRHLLRGRDQEVDLHRAERPPTARGRAPDALLRERVARRRERRDLLRPLRHGQDDALRRSVAAADRRRRARLGRHRRLQLRRWLLREDDPAFTDRRAGDLRRRRTATGRSSRTSQSTSAARSISTTRRRRRTPGPRTSSR